MATIQVRIPDTDKKAVEKVLDSLGLDMTTAVRIYLKQIVLEEGIPFTINKKKNLTVNGFTPEFEAEVLKAMDEEEGTVKFDDADDAVDFLRKRIK